MCLNRWDPTQPAWSSDSHTQSSVLYSARVRSLLTFKTGLGARNLPQVYCSQRHHWASPLHISASSTSTSSPRLSPECQTHPSSPLMIASAQMSTGHSNSHILNRPQTWASSLLCVSVNGRASTHLDRMRHSILDS